MNEKYMITWCMTLYNNGIGLFQILNSSIFLYKTLLLWVIIHCSLQLFLSIELKIEEKCQFSIGDDFGSSFSNWKYFLSFLKETRKKTIYETKQKTNQQSNCLKWKIN